MTAPNDPVATDRLGAYLATSRLSMIVVTISSGRERSVVGMFSSSDRLNANACRLDSREQRGYSILDTSLEAAKENCARRVASPSVRCKVVAGRRKARPKNQVHAEK